MREFLEKNYPEELSRDDAIKLTVKSLLEVVQTGAKNIEISVMERYGAITVRLDALTTKDHADPVALSDSAVRIWMEQNLELGEIEKIVATIESEKEAEAEKKRQRLAATQAGQAAMAMGQASGTQTPGGENDGEAVVPSAPGGESGVQ